MHLPSCGAFLHLDSFLTSLSLSLSLSILFFSPQLLLLVLVAAVWASEPPLEPCSGNGIFYPDVGACDCFQCFGGNACETVNASCVIKDLAGSPRLFQEVFWAVPEHMHKAEAILPPWYRNPYVECMGHW